MCSHIAGHIIYLTVTNQLVAHSYMLQSNFCRNIESLEMRIRRSVFFLFVLPAAIYAASIQEAAINQLQCVHSVGGSVTFDLRE